MILLSSMIPLWPYSAEGTNRLKGVCFLAMSIHVPCGIFQSLLGMHGLPLFCFVVARVGEGENAPVYCCVQHRRELEGAGGVLDIAAAFGGVLATAAPFRG